MKVQQDSTTGNIRNLGGAMQSPDTFYRPRQAKNDLIEDRGYQDLLFHSSRSTGRTLKKIDRLVNPLGIDSRDYGNGEVWFFKDQRRRRIGHLMRSPVKTKA